MAEPFKSVFNPVMIAAMAEHLAARAPGFDREGFVALASEGIEARELKDRAAQITRALDAHLPRDFVQACDLLVAALHPDDAPPFSDRPTDADGIRGWAVMPMADWVALRGLDDLDRSMAALGAMTCRFSAEFAVRPFLAREPARAMAWMHRWAGAANPHLRRLASEGCRPRLPWGMRLGVFVADPEPVIALVTRLRDDPEDNVRRSVANNLNDIAKDHPDRVAALAADWLSDAGPERHRLVRHALRSLVKAGHPEALAALGLGPAPVRLERLEIATPVVVFGTALEFSIVLRLDGDRPRALELDYAVHHVKADGATRPKVFKWRRLALEPGTALRLSRRHPMRPITTRVYRDGAHRVEIVVNGRALGAAAFRLEGTGQRVGTGSSPR
jgi:3-methyladenine DNA glycosylase AlkC